MVSQSVIEVFLDGADCVLRAISDPSVGDAWERPSVLEDQLVGGLAGHLARGAVWALDDYLKSGSPKGAPDFASAAEYFAHFCANATEQVHRGIRERGSAVGSVGSEELARTLRARLDELAPPLRAMDVSDNIAVIGGKVMRLGDYLVTRIIEQCIHLDDLARSVEHPGWYSSEAGSAIVIETGLAIARLRCGDQDLLRALFRGGFATGAFPVL